MLWFKRNEYMYSTRNLEMSIHFSLKSRPSERFHRPEMSQIKAEISLHTNVKINFHKNVGLLWYQSGIHWYHCNPTFLWKFNFTLVRRLISALIWDISGLWNHSDCRDFREKRIDISRFLALYKVCSCMV